MKQYGVILTLGNGFTEDWKLPAIVNARLKHVVNLYSQGISNNILVSGGYSYMWDIKGIKPPTTEASEMKRELVKLGVDTQDILVEDESKDTLGNLYFSKIRFLKPLKVRTILIICTDFHLHALKYLRKRSLALIMKLVSKQHHRKIQMTKPLSKHRITF